VTRAAGQPARRTWLATTIAPLALGAIVLAACGGDGDDDADSSADASTTTPNVIVTTTTIPTITVPTVTVAPTPTTPTYVTEGASVMVTNASRVDGGAGRMSDRLAAVGFTTVAPGNYTLGSLEITKIYYDPANPSAQAVAESVKVALGGGAIEVLEMPTPPPVDTGDLLGAGVLVAMGNDTADKTLEELQGIATTTTTGAPTDSSAESSTPSTSSA